MKQAIQVKYSCAGCGLYRVTLTVPARLDDQEVTDWMETVATLRIADDHARRSPHCKSRTMSEVMIPIQDSKPIGGV